MYSLGGVDLSTVSFIGGVQQNSDIALSGIFNMPARLGKTFHNWANMNGIEPYVSASEIFFGGRSLELVGFLKGIDKADCNAKFDSLVSLIDSFTDLVPLVSNWGTYQVYVNAPINGERLSSNILAVKIPMREPVVNLVGIKPTSSSAEFGIDGISFAALGGASLKLSGDRWNRPAPKTDSTSVYGKEVAIITNKQAAELTLTLGIRDLTFAGLRQKVQNLIAVLSSPGLRTLTYKNDKLRSFFVKDGFQASALYAKRAMKFCVLEVKIMQVDVFASSLDNLFDGDFYQMVDIDNNKIKLII